jgi:hypothetical protein
MTQLGQFRPRGARGPITDSDVSITCPSCQKVLTLEQARFLEEGPLSRYSCVEGCPGDLLAIRDVGGGSFNLEVYASSGLRLNIRPRTNPN